MTDSPDKYADCPDKGFPPVYGEFPEVVILGSFPGIQSLLKKEYYGNQQNHFWHIMEVLYNIDRKLPYSVRTSRLAEHRIALWDVLSGCCRAGSADIRIREPVFNDLAGFFLSHPTLRLVVLNGSAAGRYYHQLAISTPVPAVILPSTSPANTRFTLAEKVRAWEIIRTYPTQ
jgi:TDG/mug DNA glycosylase family protein